MPIAIAPLGRELEIRRVGAEDKVKKHLRELGIFEGSKITLISANGGNVIVVVKDGRLFPYTTLFRSPSGAEKFIQNINHS